MFDDFGDYDEVPVIWYCQDRKEPVAKYDEVVIGYHDLTDEQKRLARRWVDEKFSKDETKMILRALEGFTYGIEVISTKSPVEIEDGRFQYLGFEDIWNSAGYKYIPSIPAEKSNLPFGLAIFFNLRFGKVRKREESVLEN
jgi:hypothetical protein